MCASYLIHVSRVMELLHVLQVLKGHSSAILHVVVNCQEGKVLSFSKDMVRCWCEGVRVHVRM